jgi:hypothetical protein
MENLKESPTLRTCALAALGEHLPHDLLSRRESLEAEYLAGFVGRLESFGCTWVEALRRIYERPQPEDRTLIHLGGALGLSPVEIMSVTLAAAVEEDLLTGRAIAFLQSPLGGSRPTLGLLAQTFATEPGQEAVLLQVLSNGAAVRSGLLDLAHPEAPLPERPVRLPYHLCLALRGQDAQTAGTSTGLDEALYVPLPPSILMDVDRQAHGLRTNGNGGNTVLVIRSASMAESRSVAAALVAALDCRALFISGDPPEGLVPWLLLRGLLPVFTFSLGPGERKSLPPLPFYTGPALVLCGPDGSVETPAGTALSWKVKVPPPSERQVLWEQILGPGDIAARLAREHRHGSGRIAYLGRLARYHAAVDSRQEPSEQDLASAAWTAEGGGLEALAQPLPEVVPDSALVRTPELQAELDLLLHRCRLRDGLVDGLGASTVTRYHPGVRALFTGPSGTGKTLAAGWLAGRLGMPLYRVDLASVTSKYIGETEKNLAHLLAQAEQAEVVLLFDEADSLFGKRTEVKEANDRFANAQTNYLLQRIEIYDGIALLTSNSRARFDTAFTRRLDIVIEFPLPGPEQRRDLWLSHLGQEHGLTSQEINRLAVAANVSGGSIRNSVLTAAVLAGKAGRRIAYADILNGVQAEYTKLGRPAPAELAVV